MNLETAIPAVDPNLGVQLCILAGGQSRRMGYDKRRLEIDGVGLLERTLRLVAALDLPLWIAGEQGAPSPGHSSDALRWCSDGDGRGPAAGILGAANAAPGARLLVLACDLPLLSLNLIQAVLRVGSAEGIDVAVPATAGGLHPLTAVYSTRALHELQLSVATGQYSLSHFINASERKRHALNIRTLNASDLGFTDTQLEHLLLNCNTADDWQLALKLIEARPQGRHS